MKLPHTTLPGGFFFVGDQRRRWFLHPLVKRKKEKDSGRISMLVPDPIDAQWPTVAKPRAGTAASLTDAL